MLSHYMIFIRQSVKVAVGGEAVMKKHVVFLFKIQAKPQHFCPSGLGRWCLSFETPSLWKHCESSRKHLAFLLPRGELETRTVRLKDAWPGCWSKGTLHLLWGQGGLHLL